MKKCRKFLFLFVILLLVVNVHGCAWYGYVRFDGFDLYKDQLTEIAELSLRLYRSEESGKRIFLGESSVLGLEPGLEEYFEVDAELTSLLIELCNSDIPCRIDYIIIGDSFVTFTGEGRPYAIMYSEDDIKPTGIWKYDNDDLEVNKFETCWYELTD